MRRIRILPILLCLLALVTTYCYAKEVEATEEWQLLGDNDTVAAGVHVRMDITTGEKWVKQAEPETKVQDSAVAVTADGQVQPEPDYNFAMMHRVLSKLSEAERQRIGLPEAPLNPNDESFRQQMKKIWARRQAELKKWEDEHHVADLPKILAQRIQALNHFLTNPATSSLESIVSIIADLEYHLCDIDMARDFHTLGGWQVLAQFLDPDLASSINATDLEQINKIYATTAWAMGSAVKNTAEFAPFAVEPISWREGTTTTVVELLMQHLTEDAKLDKVYKVLYGLGAMLRSNHGAQMKWQEIDGPQRLSACVEAWLQEPSQATTKVCKRALSLIDDLVLEDQGFFTVPELATVAWCDSFLNALEEPDLYEVAVRAMRDFGKVCHSRKHWDPIVVMTRLSTAADLHLEKDDEDLDSSTLKDHLRLMDQVNEVLGL